MFFAVHKLVSIVSFRGRILFKDHNINHVNEASVTILKCLNSRDNTLENNTIQIIAHAKNMHIGSISKFLIANIIASYSHNKTSIKLPEIPGRIIAQIAIAQHAKIYNKDDELASGALVGDVIK